MPNQGPPVHFINIEYFFELLYNLLHGVHSSGSTPSSGNLLVTFSHLWLLFTILAYLFSLAAIGVIVYTTMRIYQIRKEEEPLYETIPEEKERQHVEHDRWNHVMQLIESGQESDWRQAVIEADIMLDELLDRLGYQGESVGEKLRAVNPGQFQTLNNAWEAHRVRNEIAHQGSAYQLTEHQAHRTIANYEAVFREHGEI